MNSYLVRKTAFGPVAIAWRPSPRGAVVCQVFLSDSTSPAEDKLRRAYPVAIPNIADFAVNEPSDYPDGEAQPYAGIRTEYIDPIEKSYALCLRVSTAIANHFGAHG